MKFPIIIFGMLVVFNCSDVNLNCIDYDGDCNLLVVSYLLQPVCVNIECPTGYIQAPCNLQTGTTGNFCVAKYEMKCASDVTGMACSGEALSQMANRPWVNITQSVAASKCMALGSEYHLITNPEWMTLARNIENQNQNWSLGSVNHGALNQGHSDGFPVNSLTASNDNDSCTGTGQSCSHSIWNTQRRTHRLSNGEVIWDLSGNVIDWINWNVLTDKSSPQNSFIEINADSAPTSTMTETTFQSTNKTMTTNQGIGNYFPGSDGVGGAALRGGSCCTMENAGVFALKLDLIPATSAITIGFRCAYQPN